MTSGLQATWRPLPHKGTPPGLPVISSLPARAFDVAVVGLGPVGSVAAALLSQAGLRVYACDRNPGLQEHPGTVSLEGDVLRVLDQIGVLGALRPHMQPFGASQCLGVDGQVICAGGPPRAWPGERPAEHAASYVLSQRELERALHQNLLRQSTLLVARGCELTQLFSSDNHVQLELRAEDGGSDKVRAGWVLACDGAASTVRQQLDIGLEHFGFDEPWLVVDTLIREHARAKLPQVSTQFCEPSRPCRYVVGPGLYRRWELALQSHERSGDSNTQAHAWQLLSRWIGPEDAQIVHVASHRFHVALAQRWRAGRVFLAGDAAQVQPPFLGQGLSQGIRDVSNLSWKIAAVQHGQTKAVARERLLKSYTSERRQLSRELLLEAAAQCMQLTERDEEKARERDARLLAERERVPYPAEPQPAWLPQLRVGFLGGVPSIARGKLFPQTRLALSGGDAISMDHHFGYGWRIIADEQLRFHAAISGMDVITLGSRGFTETEGVAADWMRQHDCLAVLLRPDHYVYGDAVTPDALRRLVEGWRREMNGS